MRENLIELLSESVSKFCKLSVIRGTTKITAIQVNADEFADHLIANGVTIPVRCKDCIWFDLEDELPDVFRSEQYCYCTEANTYVPINHFCSFGERRTDD